MNKKGQALVEFILILPVLIFILLAIFDVGMLFMSKYDLNNNLDTVADFYMNGEEKKALALASLDNFNIDPKNEDDMLLITVSKKIDTTFLKNYELKTSKSIFKEESYE